MMAAVREWLTAVVAVSLLLSVAQALVPKGPLRETVSLIGGLILLTALLQPLLHLDLEMLDLDMETYRQSVEQRQEELAADREAELKRLIEAAAEAYISDKARSLGMDIQVCVTAESGTGGIPVPVRAELTGPRSKELAQWMEKELGLSAEGQVWR